jgi:hypothetical protein
MQVNSAQDYLTAQKRRIVAATFALDPPPAHRKYNYVYVSMLANKATQYDKVAYPQTLSLAGRSIPGGAYTAAGAPITQPSQSNRPVVNSCVTCPVAAVNNALPGSLI